jgi:hypothetical protein
MAARITRILVAFIVSVVVGFLLASVFTVSSCSRGWRAWGRRSGSGTGCA